MTTSPAMMNSARSPERMVLAAVASNAMIESLSLTSGGTATLPGGLACLPHGAPILVGFNGRLISAYACSNVGTSEAVRDTSPGVCLAFLLVVDGRRGWEESRELLSRLDPCAFQALAGIEGMTVAHDGGFAVLVSHLPPGGFGAWQVD